ncbi:serine/threonine protein kinase [Maudiozyma humilis]|uniref:non-specific serine/threonine protein kinase n=1 Tax=Maudiozyma humilis TaxID=51915 RepID=A0AAV5RU03_MAUHU|nr:serine/threonine protein kinase [Kazachstania humilis]
MAMEEEYTASQLQTGSEDVSGVPPLPRIDGLELGETIGQGAFGCVRVAYQTVKPSALFAVKFMHMPTCAKSGMDPKDLVQEVKLQAKCSKHQNVLRVLDCRKSDEFLCVFLELAAGGDLFDKIEPDVGVDNDIAQFYFRQLVNALTYMHEECGIAHRDIKPENVLLDKNGNLKLADFGLASQFRRKDGSKRVSHDKRGSYPYMAPEILVSDSPLYYADITDIWSIGILVFVLLTGEIPWELPTAEDDNFVNFTRNNGNLNLGPWAKIEFSDLNLLRKILQRDPKKRITLQQLKRHPWYTRPLDFASSNGMCSNPQLLARKLFAKLRISLSDENYDMFTQAPGVPGIASNRGDDGPGNFASTQPLNSEIGGILHDSLRTDDHVNSTQITTFSQYVPRTANTSALLKGDDADDKSAKPKDERWKERINSDFAMLQFHTNADLGQFRLNKVDPFKLDKFYSIHSMDDILPTLEKAFQLRSIMVKPDLLGAFKELLEKYGPDEVFPMHINIISKDRLKNNLAGVLTIIVIDEELKCINFQRKSGDPLEWRRLFKDITLYCRDLIYLPDN